MKKLQIILAISIMLSLFSVNTYAEDDMDIESFIMGEDAGFGTEDNKVNADGSVENKDSSYSKDGVNNSDGQSVNENTTNNGDQNLNEGAKMTPTPISAPTSGNKADEEVEYNSAGEMNSAEEITVTKLPQTGTQEVLLLIFSLLIAGMFMYIRNTKKA